MINNCNIFEPNLWQPKKCKNCFKLWDEHNSAVTIRTQLKTIEHTEQLTSARHEHSRFGVTTNNDDTLSPKNNYNKHRHSTNNKLSPINSPKPTPIARTSYSITKTQTNTTRNNHQTSAPSTSKTLTAECTVFASNVWRPNICIHCYRTLSLHPSTTTTTTTTTTNTLTVTVSTTLESTTPIDREPRSATTSSTSIITPTTSHEEEDDDPFADFSDDEEYDDPFKDFSDDDSTTSTSSRFSSKQSSSSESNNLNSPQMQKFKAQFSRYEEEDDDWDKDVEIDSTYISEEYTYVNNKMMEIMTVKEEAQRAGDNSHQVVALFEVLQAKQQQIQKAFERSTINEEDHSSLLERLNSVRHMLLTSEDVALY